jgi:hypothetical protein
MKMFKTLSCVLCLLMFHGRLFAAENSTEQGRRENRAQEFSQEKMVDARGKKITVVNFDDAVIEGKARGPDGFVLRSRDASGGRSVLELRRDFRVETLSDALGGIPVVPSLP